MVFPKKIPHPSLDNLRLGYFELAHAKELYALIDSNRDYLRRWLPWLDTCKDPSNSISFIEMAINGYRANTNLSLGIFLGDALIGTIAFHKFDWETRSSGIGYWLAEKYQGQNIMYAACKTLVEYGFGDLALDQISISCSTLNAKSQSIPRKLGFVNPALVEKKENLYGTLVDHVVYAMSKERWLSLTTAPRRAAYPF